MLCVGQEPRVMCVGTNRGHQVETKEKRDRTKVERRVVSRPYRVESIRVGFFAQGGRALLCFGVVKLFCFAPFSTLEFQVRLGCGGGRMKRTDGMPGPSLPEAAQIFPVSEFRTWSL